MARLILLSLRVTCIQSRIDSTCKLTFCLYGMATD